ncbi:MAG: CCA tRNA nucleotidyltransferase [Lachnospiraceae bacterium]|nr:CCA tRNA nucleotidyltransferase [Lachnospiraceae bacterium]
MEYKINMPPGAARIIRVLNGAGFTGYVVGGCVRDSVMGREPKDWDITTSASPEQVKKLFKRTVDTGIAHGTVTVLTDGDSFEVTTYRVDGKYSDGRHPDSVRFVTELREDLARRDFTINAMAYNDADGLVDEFGGLEDIDRRVIRCVGEAKERFTEDALRMMRALRFGAQLGFEIEENTFDAIRELAHTIEKISAERVREELTKLLISDNPGQVLRLCETGLSKYIFPQLDEMLVCEQNTKFHCYTVGYHTVKVVESVGATVALRYAALLHDVGKLYTKTTIDGVDHFYGHAKVSAQFAEKFMQKLKFDNATTELVKLLVTHHDSRIKNMGSVRRLVGAVGAEHVEELLDLMYADLAGKSDYARSRTEALDRLAQDMRQVVRDGECVKLKDLKISGRDLMEAGFKPGPGMGRILNALLEAVMDDPAKNDKEILMSMAQGMDI